MIWRACSLVVLVAFVGIAVAQCSLRRERNSDEALLPRAIEIQVSRLSGPVESHLRTQSWIRDNRHLEEAMFLLASIVQADMVVQQQGQDASSLVRILQEAERQKWYRNGLDRSDIARLESLFGAFRLGTSQALQVPAVEPLVIQGLHDSSAREVTLPASGKVTILTLADDSSVSSAALGIVRTSLSKVDQYLGTTNINWLVVAVVELGQPRCMTDAFAPVILLAPECLSEGPVLHELTHIYMGANFPTWFTEGVALFLAGSLSGLEPQEAQRRLRGRLDGVGAEPTIHLDYYGPEEGAYLYERSAGALLLYDALAIVGPDRLREALRLLKRSTTGDDILTVILSTASDEQRPALQVLIDERVAK